MGLECGGRGGGRRAWRVPFVDRRSRVRAGQWRRLRRAVRGAGGAVPALAHGLRRRARGRVARDVFHGLGQPVRPRPAAVRRDGAGPWRHQRHRRDRDPARPRIRRAGLCDRRLAREVRGLRPAGRGWRDGLPRDRLRRRHQAVHVRAWRGRRARHGGRAVSGAEPRLPGDGRTARADRVPGRREGRVVRHDEGHDPAADDHRVDHAAADRRAEGGDRRYTARARVAQARHRAVRAGDPCDVPVGAGGERAPADGKQPAHSARIVLLP